MQALARINHTHDHANSHRLFKILAFAIVVLILSAAAAMGDLTIIDNQSSTDIEGDAESRDGEERNQSVAMKIDVDEDDVLDLDMARGDVVVDTWDGDDVLVIVEKTAKPDLSSDNKPTSLDIKVTRHGNNISIATLDVEGQPFSHPTWSLRIMVPRRQVEATNVSSIYDLSKLTSVVFKALRGEALKWIGR